MVVRSAAAIVFVGAACAVLLSPAASAFSGERRASVISATDGRAPAPFALSTRPERDVRVEDFFSRREIERAEQYRGPRYAFTFATLIATLGSLGLLTFGPLARRARRRAERLSCGRWAAHAFALVVIATAVPALITLPLSLALHRHDRAYGLATDTVAARLGDLAKALGYELAIAAVIGLGFVWLARALPRAWPIAAGAGGIALVVAGAFLFPVLYEPAFNRFRPVDPATRARVLALARRAEVPVRDVLVADASRRTTRQNAYVSGFGSTRRIVLYDTLLRESSAREVDLVVAHELAHVKHDDVLRGVALGSIGMVAGVAVLWGLLSGSRVRRILTVERAGDPNVVPFLALFLSLTGLLTLPLVNSISRAQEAAADRAAIAITGDPDTAVRVEVNLARDNVADLDPNAFVRTVLFSHPPVLDRIGIALDLGASRP